MLDDKRRVVRPRRSDDASAERGGSTGSLADL